MASAKRNQPIERFMTPAPQCIGVTQTLEKAHELLREHGIRHLPVLKRGKLVGVVSDRDLALVEALPGVDPTEITVEEAMSLDVFEVGPEAPLGEVALEMAENKYGSAVVTKGREVIGVFTTTDALRALV